MTENKSEFNEISEYETRIKVFANCREHYGPEAERQLRLTFDKWDKVLAKCTNLEERKHISVMASAEIYKMMNYAGGLSVNGKVIIADDA